MGPLLLSSTQPSFWSPDSDVWPLLDILPWPPRLMSHSACHLLSIPSLSLPCPKCGSNCALSQWIQFNKPESCGIRYPSLTLCFSLPFPRPPSSHYLSNLFTTLHYHYYCSISFLLSNKNLYVCLPTSASPLSFLCFPRWAVLSVYTYVHFCVCSCPYWTVSFLPLGLMPRILFILKKRSGT